MNTYVASHAEAVQAATGHDLILICTPGGWKAGAAAQAMQAAKSVLILEFNDVTYEWPEEFGPEPYHIATALAWCGCPRRQSIVVSCDAGVSRSSGLAYVIGCSKMEPTEAVKMLTPGRHHPNGLVVRLGAERLGKPGMIDVLAQHGF